MFIRSLMAVEINSRCIKVICTRKFFGKSILQAYGLMELPSGIVEQGDVKDVEFVVDTIKKFMNDNCMNPKEISFAIYGQDIIIKHVEIPILNEKCIKKTIKWDISQYLSVSHSNYIIDFEITEKIMNSNKKAYGVLVVLVPKTKIEKYSDIAKNLGIRLRAIDISANCISRVFKNLINSQSDFESIGVIDIGNQNTQLIIIHKGKLFIQKEVQFGLEDVLKEVSDKYKIDSIETYQYLTDKFSLDDTYRQDGLEKKISGYFDNVIKALSTIIQFYLMDKSKKNIDKIFIVGEGSIIKGAENYISNFLGVDTFVLDRNKELKQILGFKEKASYTKYINLFGLLLRKE